MNKYYSFISLSLSSDPPTNTIKINNISSQKKKKKDTTNWSVNILDDQKMSCRRVNAVFNAYYSKKQFTETNLWNYRYTLWKFEIINRKEPLRYLKPNTVYSEPHASYDSLLHSTNTHDTSYENETTTFRQKRKQILLHLWILLKKQVFIWKQIYVNAAKCCTTWKTIITQRLLHFINCITHYLAASKFHLNFWSAFDQSEKQHNHLKGWRLQQQGFLTVKKINK